MIPELCQLSAQSLSERIRRQELSPVEVVDAHLAHIEATEPAINAFITVTGDHARERAREAEAEIAAGNWRGPLHGIPYAPKDILATAGILTTNGSKATADWVPDYESTITARLNDAGAILVGKLNLLEFAMGSGVLSGFGPARNPWATDYTPSGSSSGSGAALAARLVPLSIGTDTGGSIRGPAAACGIVGLKQTYGRISRFGVTTLSWTLDHAGPMTRTAWDAAAMLGAIAGADPRDVTAADQPVPDYLAGLTPDVSGLRIGVPGSGFFDAATPEVQEAVQTAIALLTADGAEIVEVEIPHAQLAGSAGWIVAMAEAATFHEKRLAEQPEDLDPLVRERLEVAKFYPATDYIKALRVRTILQQEMAEVFRNCDVMIVPSSFSPADSLRSEEAAGSDVRAGTDPDELTTRPGNTFIGNMTGYPGLTMGCGFSAEAPKRPLALQIYGPPFSEARLLQVAHAYQERTAWHEELPPV